MARYVVDPPTVLHLLDGGLPVDPAHQLFAPSSIRSEALQLLLLGDRVSRGTAWRIAREHDWDTLRDAEYLAVTRLQADALVTVDPDLAAAAQGVVPVAPLSALLAVE